LWQGGSALADCKYNRVLIVLIVLGLVAALAVGWQRHTLESANVRVEMVMDYEDIVELAEAEGIPTPALLQQFKAAGITSLAVYETTLEKLNKSGKVTAMPGSHFLHQYRTGTLSDPYWRSLVETGQIEAEDIYVVGQDPAVFAEVQSDLARRLSPERVRLLPGRDNVLAAKGNYEKAVKWNLGLSTSEMKEVAGQGFMVVARPTNYVKVRAEDVEAVFDRLAAVEQVSTVMFVGEEALGYPGQVNLTMEKMRQRDLTLGMIEHPLQLQFVKQEGLTALAALNGYKAARVYVIPKDEQPKLKLSEAVHRWAVTDLERNIRINMLRKFDKPEPGKTLLETNLAYVAGVRAEMESRGLSIGRAGTFPPFFPSPWLLAVVISGATAAGVLFLTQLRSFAPRYQYLLWLVLTLILAIPVLKGSGMVVRQAAALASAILFPVLAMTWQLDRWRSLAPARGASLLRILRDGVCGLTITVFLSMIGGFYISAILGDVRFFLEMEIYRGVKLTFVMPLVLISLVYLTRYEIFKTSGAHDVRGAWQQVVKLLDYPVYVKTMVIAAAVAVVAWVFVGRSGHTAGVPVPEFELKLRAFLEDAMYARPREKEFMIGHPAFFLAAMAVWRQWPRMLHFALVVMATIGQGSLVETFAHMRTPLFMSFVRGLDGLAVGLVMGILAVVGVQILHYLSFFLGKETARR